MRLLRNLLADFFLWDAEDVRRERWVRRSQELARRSSGR